MQCPRPRSGSVDAGAARGSESSSCAAIRYTSRNLFTQTGKQQPCGESAGRVYFVTPAVRSTGHGACHVRAACMTDHVVSLTPISSCPSSRSRSSTRVRSRSRQHLAATTAATPTARPTSHAAGTTRGELNLINLPTTTSLNKHQSYFRLTHRFARDLRRGDFGSLAEDFFSLDNGAVIGLEYRFGITSHLQAGVHRTTLSKTIQFFGRYDALAPERVACRWPSRMLGSVEGLANFHQNYQPGVGAVISRALAPGSSSMPTPTFVAHTRAADTLSRPRRSRPRSAGDGRRRPLASRRNDLHRYRGARPHPADGLRRRRVLTARAGPRSRARRMGSRDREADGGPHDATEFHQRVRHDARADRARRQPARRLSRVQSGEAILSAVDRDPWSGIGVRDTPAHEGFGPGSPSRQPRSR